MSTLRTRRLLGTAPIRMLSLAFALAMPGTGCGVESPVPRAVQKTVEVPDDLVHGINQMAIRLFMSTCENQPNCVMGPSSIAGALALLELANSSKNSKEAAPIASAIRNALGNVNIQDIFPALMNGEDSPWNQGISVPGGSEEFLEIQSSASIFVKDSVNVDPSLTDSLEQLYGGSVYKLDQRSINEWVNAATNGNIPSLEISGIESGNIEAALMAAQFFKAEWMYKFPEAETSPGAFDDERQDNPYACMMRLSSDDEIIRIADFTVDEVDYKVTRLSFRDNGEGRGYSFHIYSSDGTSILPHSDNLLQYLLAQGLVRFDDMRKSNGVVRFPRFKISPNQTHQISPSSLALRDASGNMFSTFPLAWVGNDLSVANITHKAAVQIDESGGEAASVTSLAGTRGGSSMPFFNHDKPFLAMILDPSGTILFMMMVTDPVDPFVEDAVTADTDCQVGSFTPAAP